MLKSRRNEILVAMVLIAPFVVVYGWLFIYPTIQMVRLSFTNAPLIGEGAWIGLDNYVRLFSDRIFRTAVWNTGYFVLLTVIPGTAVALAHRDDGEPAQGLDAEHHPRCLLPALHPAGDGGLPDLVVDLRHPVRHRPVHHRADRRPAGQRLARGRWFMPMAALVTIWWTNGFSILLFLAGLRNISPEIYEAAALDGATRWQVFWRITWPLIWPVTVLCLTIQLILQLKIFDQVYLFSLGGRTNTTMVLVQYIYEQAFVHNKGGYGATIAVALFVLVVVVSVLQYQALRAQGCAMSTAPRAMAYAGSAEYRRIRYLDIGGLILTLLTVIAAVIWAFPLYWAVITTFKPEHEVVRPYIELLARHLHRSRPISTSSPTPRSCRWYINSIIVSGVITVLVVGDGCGLRLRHLAAPLSRAGRFCGG